MANVQFLINRQGGDSKALLQRDQVGHVTCGSWAQTNPGNCSDQGGRSGVHRPAINQTQSNAHRRSGEGDSFWRSWKTQHFLPPISQESIS